MTRLIMAVFLLAWSAQVTADSFRCGRAVVKVGNSANDLSEKCGKQGRSFSSRETINDHGRTYEAGVSNWVYDRDRNNYMIVSVHSGAIIRIRVD